MEAINWTDQAQNSGGRVIFTQQQLHIPGLRMFGRYHTPKAVSALSAHYHENCLELTFLAKGSLHFAMQGKGYDLCGGDLFVVNPNVVHDTQAQPLGMHTMYWLQLITNDPANFLFLNCQAAQALIDRLTHLSSPVIKLPLDSAQETLHRIFTCLSSHEALQREAGAALLLYFLYTVLQSADLPFFSLQPNIGKAVNLALERVDEPLSIEELAAAAGLSVSRFKQKFKSQMGLPPREFVNSEKIRAAKQLLQEGRSVTDTAMELGFSSSNYFCVVFRRHTGFSPRQYRRSFCSGKLGP